jgi:diadenosine tetraphosphate (Ap4A) HIT family hydrolase
MSQTYNAELEKIHANHTCPFCSIDPKNIIIDYETAYMTLAKAPYHPDHLLIIPKSHRESYLNLTAEESDEIQALCRRGVKLLKQLGYTDMSVLVREGMASGKSIEHLHYHVIPHTLIGDLTHDGNNRMFLNESDTLANITRIQNADTILKSKINKK